MLRRFLSLFAVSLVSTVLSAAGAAPGSAASAPSPLDTDGRWVVDQQGRTLYVHGLQIAHKKPPYHPPAGGVTDADAVLIKSLGINAVRLAWFWKGMEPKRSQIDEDYLAEIVHEVDVLTRNGLWVLVEFHQDNYNELVHGAGFPDWATFIDGWPNPGELVPGMSAFTNPALQRAFDNLYANREGIQDDMARTWQVLVREIAKKSAGNDRLLGYDLFNEPWPGTAFPLCLPPLGCAHFDKRKLQPLQDKLALAVRDEDATTPIFYEPHLLADIGSPTFLTAPPKRVAPVVFGFHDYCGTSLLTKKADKESESLGYPACPALDKLVYLHGVNAGKRMDAAVMQTEFGDTQDLAELERVMQLGDKHLTGWMLWGYKDWIDYPGGIGDGDLFDDPDDVTTIRESMADVVARAVPQWIAGTPTKYGYDPKSGQMVLEWTPRPGKGGLTEVFVPLERHYPNGYTVRVTGGTVTSAKDAGLLTVKNTGGKAKLVLTKR
jgi:endoglycosylceramidase